MATVEINAMDSLVNPILKSFTSIAVYYHISSGQAEKLETKATLFES
jgi:hypothetical protein